MSRPGWLIGVAGLCASLLLVGCGAQERPGPGASEGASSTEYVAAVEGALAPAVALAGITADRLAGRPSRTGAAGGLVREATGELDALRRLPLSDPGLRAQRARIVRALTPVLARMRQVARDLPGEDPAALRRSGIRLLDALEDLPSATAA